MPERKQTKTIAAYVVAHRLHPDHEHGWRMVVLQAEDMNIDGEEFASFLQFCTQEIDKFPLGLLVELEPKPADIGGK